MTTKQVNNSWDTLDVPPYLWIDGYKLAHRNQYPQKTETVYATWIHRGAKWLMDTSHAVHFGLQAYIKKHLLDYWQKGFFQIPFAEIKETYQSFMEVYLGVKDADVSHLEYLHNLGYLPLEIKAVKEGSLVPMRCPSVSITNTDPNCFWLTNYIETHFSCCNWMPSAVATKAMIYKSILQKWTDRTCDNRYAIPFQAHDFSARGMAAPEACQVSGAGHLLSFSGTDSIPAMFHLKKFYGGWDGCSISATEHSVASVAIGDLSLFKGKEKLNEVKRREKEFILHLLNNVEIDNFFSYVSDTYNLWGVLDILNEDDVKRKILSRNGRMVIRPDSGDPVRILTGHTEHELAIKKHSFRIETMGEYRKLMKTYHETDKNLYWIEEEGDFFRWINNEPIKMPHWEKVGVVEALFGIFGGVTNDKGFKVLDGRIGTIYGDAITVKRMNEILQRLEDKGFAASNVVFGIGSVSYQYMTRDSTGLAIKTSQARVDGVEMDVVKDPLTDDGLKKSIKGKAVVWMDKNGIIDGYTDNSFPANIEEIAHQKGLIPAFETVFKDGEILVEDTFNNIKSRLNEQLELVDLSYNLSFAEF